MSAAQQARQVELFRRNCGRVVGAVRAHMFGPALEAVLAACRDVGVRDYVCLGDIVGYGASPNACVERVRALTEVKDWVRLERAYRKMLAQKLDAKVRDPQLCNEERWKAVRSSCDQMIKDVLLLPGKTEAVDAIGDIGRAFTEWSRDESNGFSYLLDMSAHDFYTTSHMVNVGVGCGLLAKELHPDDAAMLAVIVQGGMLHDIGKRSIPETILNKEGKLDPEEWTEIQKHPKLGFDELVKHSALPPIVSLMARDHHERIDGKGYPQGLAQDEISFAARVCAVVDVYDALTSDRPYRKAWPKEKAIKHIKAEAGAHFDPKVVEAFLGYSKQ